MKHYMFKSILAISVLLATSCASTKYLSIDVLKPASIKFDEKIVGITVVDNAGTQIIATDNETELEKATAYGKEVFINSLVQFMQEEEYFYEVSLYPTAIRSDKSYGTQVPLIKSQVSQIAKEMDADAVISIDAFETRVGKALVNMDGFIFSGTKANSSILFRIYDSNGTLITPIMTSEDSIYWMEDRGLQYDLEYYTQLAAQLSEGMSKQLIPYWEAQERHYYTDGTKYMKEANQYVEKGEWSEAAKTWGVAFEDQKDDKQKAKIASNIALANEYLGDIENATNWIRISSNLINTTSRHSTEYQYINWYKIKMLERERDNPKVLKQMGIEVIEE